MRKSCAPGRKDAVPTKGGKCPENRGGTAADGALRLVGRAVGVADPTHAYFIDTPVSGGNNALPERSTPRRADAR